MNYCYFSAKNKNKKYVAGVEITAGCRQKPTKEIG